MSNSDESPLISGLDEKMELVPVTDLPGHADETPPPNVRREWICDRPLTPDRYDQKEQKMQPLQQTTPNKRKCADSDPTDFGSAAPQTSIIDLAVAIADKLSMRISEKENKENEEPPLAHRVVISIDIGIKHFAIVAALIFENFSFDEVVWIDLIDIKLFQHRWGPDRKRCRLFHTRTPADWVEHMFQENLWVFQFADYVLLERQPPLGLVAVEQLVFNKYRPLSRLIHPVAMHHYFKINHLDYEGRKAQTEIIAKHTLKTNPDLLEQWLLYERQHDIADAICILHYFLFISKQKYDKEQLIKRTVLPSLRKLESFRFIDKGLVPLEV